MFFCCVFVTAPTLQADDSAAIIDNRRHEQVDGHSKDIRYLDCIARGFSRPTQLEIARPMAWKDLTIATIVKYW